MNTVYDLVSEVKLLYEIYCSSLIGGCMKNEKKGNMMDLDKTHLSKHLGELGGGVNYENNALFPSPSPK